MTARKLALGILVHLAIFGACLFLPAGTLNWPRAWAFLAIDFVAVVATTVYLNRVNPAVIEARFAPPLQKGQPLADKLVTVLLLAAFVAVVILIPLDVFRFHLLPEPGLAVASIGLALFIVGWLIMTLALKENAFAAPVVKHQERTQHRVIDSGVYAVVRHPMYAGLAPWLAGMALWLESYPAALATIIPMAILLVRIQIEEQFLTRELPGYEDYKQRVRYRLIPFIW